MLIAIVFTLSEAFRRNVAAMIGALNTIKAETLHLQSRRINGT
jgi:hypothetical protein